MYIFECKPIKMIKIISLTEKNIKTNVLLEKFCFCNMI